MSHYISTMRTLNNLDIDERLTKAYDDLADKYTIPIKFKNGNTYEVKPVVLPPDDTNVGLPYGFAVYDMTNKPLVARIQNSGNFEKYLQSSEAHIDALSFAKSIDINKLEQMRDVLDKFAKGETPSISDINLPLKDQNYIITTSNKHDWGCDFAEAVNQKLPKGRHGAYFMFAVDESNLEYVVKAFYLTEMPECTRKHSQKHIVLEALRKYSEFDMQALDMNGCESSPKIFADIKWDCDFSYGDAIRCSKGWSALSGINKGFEASRRAVEADKMAEQAKTLDKH